MPDVSTNLRTKIFLTTNRWVVTGLILSSVFLTLTLFGYFDFSPFRSIVENQGGLHFIFAAFIGAIITGTSIVVTINQLVLSQELGAVGKQQSRMQESMDFRQEVENHLELEISSPEPSAFTQELIQRTKQRASHLTKNIESDSSEVRNKVEDYSKSLIQNADVVAEKLEEAQFGTFEVIWAALNFNYSEKIYQARQIKADHKQELSEESIETLEDLIDLLTLFGPAREHFKTLYFQWELIKLSRALMYSSIFALTSIGVLIMHINSATITGTTLGIDNLILITSAGFTIGITPFIIFIVFLLRIATVAKRTLAMGPFILRENE